MLYVFDASFIAALIIPDEKNPKVDELRSTIGENEEIFVPQLLWYEIANIFNNVVLRKRYSFEEALQFLPFLEAIRLTTDFETGIGYTEKLMHLSKEYKLSSYDTAYLELAGRKKATLCTFDEELQKAAPQYGVKLLK